MRINRLTVQGFGPYKTEQHVDFDAFADDGIFLMGGKTGAGKSSILDAICFALYDDVPRYDGTKSRLRSDHSGPDDASLVTLEFTASDNRYRVERAPEYDKRKARGVGTTKQKAEATLYELQGSEWVGIEAGPRMVGPRIAELVGLNKDQFLQVILLAQNRFQQFLLAKSDARQEVLRSLFGTSRFQDYELTVVEARKSLDAEIGSRHITLTQLLEHAAATARAMGIGGTLDSATALDTLNGELKNDPEAELLAIPESRIPEQVLPWLEALNNACSARVQAAASLQEHADARFTLIDADHDELVVQRAGQLRRNNAEQRLQQLSTASEAIDRDRTALAASARAELVASTISAVERARAAAHTIDIGYESARAGFANEVGDAMEHATDATTPEKIERFIEQTTLEQGSLDDAVLREQQRPALQTQLKLLELAEHESEAALNDALTRAAELPQIITAGEAQLAEFKLAASTLASATAERDRLAVSLAHAREAASLTVRLSDARTHELSAGQASTAASGELDRLRAARLSGQAAELAASLREGEACAVCGSLEHPHPARASDDAVDQDQIEAAEATLAERRRLSDDAREAASALANQLAAATAAAAHRSVEDLTTLTVDADAAVSAAITAQNQAVTLAGQLETSRAEHSNAEAAVAAHREVLSAATTSRVAAATHLESDEKRLAAQRAEFDTVAARSEALAARLHVARTLVRALNASLAAHSAVGEADAALSDALTAQSFASADEASSALLDAQTRAGIEQRVRAHDDALAAATATLNEPELVGLPREDVSLEHSEAVLAAARDARDHALSTHAAVKGQADALHELIARADQLLAASAELIERHHVVARLAATLKGDEPNTRRMRLESFVLAAELEQIVAAANARLKQMSGGRYALEHDDSIAHRSTQSGLGLAILDSHTGVQRPTHSLSGGETFLASLALALGLSEVVTARTGGITLDTLFIDEGFGSLDADTLEIAMSTLDSLRTGGRTIGLISHVEAMKEQIHASLQVTVSDQGWSVISQGAS